MDAKLGAHVDPEQQPFADGTQRDLFDQAPGRAQPVQASAAGEHEPHEVAEVVEQSNSQIVK